MTGVHADDWQIQNSCVLYLDGRIFLDDRHGVKVSHTHKNGCEWIKTDLAGDAMPRIQATLQLVNTEV